MGQCMLSKFHGVRELITAVVTVVIAYPVVERTDVGVVYDCYGVPVYHVVMVWLFVFLLR